MLAGIGVGQVGGVGEGERGGEDKIVGAADDLDGFLGGVVHDGEAGGVGAASERGGGLEEVAVAEFLVGQVAGGIGDNGGEEHGGGIILADGHAGAGGGGGGQLNGGGQGEREEDIDRFHRLNGFFGLVVFWCQSWFPRAG